MTRRTLSICFLVAVFLLTLASPALAGASADEWASIKREALQQYMSSTDKSRVDALMKMGAADCRGAAEILIKLLKARTPDEDALLKMGKEIEKKIDGIYARNKSLLKKNMISQVDAMEIQKLNFLTRVKQKISDALAKCKSQVAYIIDKMLDDSGWQVRMEGVQALAVIGTASAVEAVKGMVSDGDFKVRTEALEIALKQGYKGMEKEYITALKDDWWQVRTVAIRAIQQKKIYKAVGPLIEALEVEDGRLTL